MKRFLRTAAAVLLTAGVLASPCAAGAQQGRSLLYRAQGPGGATVYMLGSIHLLDAGVYPLPQHVQEAYSDAERVVFETSIDSLAGRNVEFTVRGTYQDGRTLRDAIPADLYDRVQAVAPTLGRLGINIQVLDQMEPWMAAMTFQLVAWHRAGMVPEHGVDAHFFGRAREDGKPVGALESVRFQMELFDAMPHEEQVALLRQSLEDMPRAADEMRQIVGAWRSGDAAALDAIVSRSMGRSPALYARMLTNRNTAWVPQIEQMLAGRDDVLVVVGAAHLVGEHSVVAMLGRRGYTVEQM